MAPKAPGQQALIDAIQVRPEQAARIMDIGPIVQNGCVLQPPPTTVKVGPVFSFNIADWKAAAERYKTAPKGPEQYLQFKIGLSPEADAWVLSQYAKISRQKFVRMVGMAGSVGAVPAGSEAAFRPKPLWLQHAIKIGFGTSPVWGEATFTNEYKGIKSPWPGGADAKLPTDPGALIDHIKAGHFLLWRELVDGAPNAPVAKVEPPFDDDGHKWVLRVGYTGRMVQGVNLATGGRQAQPEAQVILMRLPTGILDAIEGALGAVLDLFKAVLATVCNLITADKLQEIRNYGTMFPNPQVQAVVLAWQGAAQACNAIFPSTATGPPNCAVTAETPPLPAPDSWWKIHQTQLIGAGIALAGVAGIAYFLRHSRA